MRRRDLLRLAAAMPILGAHLRAQADIPFRRVRPADPHWPNRGQWDELKAAVGGNLIQPTDLAAACREGAQSPACTEVLKHLRNPFYIGDQPGGTQVSGWLGAWAPARSEYAVVAHTSADVVAAVNFAREHKLRIVVKGGGHSYLGTSNSADSLLIWTRAMHQIELHDRFVPQGCSAPNITPTPAVTVEAGAVWMDVYDAVTTKGGRYAQGGGCTTVGVAGHVQSGGFGSFSKGYGTAAGSLLQAEVVTADGRLRIVNAACDPELFWGLKGGGGGSLGVVTKVTLKTHELAGSAGGASGAIKAASDAGFRRLVRRFVDFYAEALLNPHWGEEAHIRPGNVLHLSMVCQGLDPRTTAQTWEPFFAWVRSEPQEFQFVEPAFARAFDGLARSWWDVEQRRRFAPGSMISDDRQGAPATHAWWDGDQEQVGMFLYGFESIWLPASLLTAAQREPLANALFAASRYMEVQLHFNKGLAGAPPEAIAAARDTAMNPLALDAFALAIIATGGPARYPGLPDPPKDAERARQAARAIDDAARCLREVAPAAGSYVSESNYFNPRWAQAYWGAHYPRLRKVKRAYDPDGLFFVHNGVGSEDWSADGFTRLRNT